MRCAKRIARLRDGLAFSAASRRVEVEKVANPCPVAAAASSQSRRQSFGIRWGVPLIAALSDRFPSFDCDSRVTVGSPISLRCGGQAFLLAISLPVDWPRRRTTGQRGGRWTKPAGLFDASQLPPNRFTPNGLLLAKTLKRPCRRRFSW